jgi:hypothetical protein
MVKTKEQLAAENGVPVPTIEGQGGNDPALYWGPWVQAAGMSPGALKPRAGGKRPTDALFNAQVPDFDPMSQAAPGSSLGLQATGVSTDYYSQVPKAAQEDYSDEARHSQSTVNGAMQYLAQLQATDYESFFKIGDEMVHLGFLKPGYQPADVYGVWEAAAKKAAFVFNNGQGTPLTINQVLHMDSPKFGGSGLSSLAGTQTGAGRMTTHSDTSQANISSLSEIKGATRSLSADALGRDVSSSELARIAAYVQGAQANNPTITDRTDVTTGVDATINTPGHSSTKSTVVTHGGLDANTTIEDRLRENPDYAEHQAAAVYAPALFRALGATV